MDKKIITVTVYYGEQGRNTPLVGKDVNFIFKKEDSDEVASRSAVTDFEGKARVTIDKDDYLEPFDSWIAYATHNNFEKNTGYCDITTTLTGLLTFTGNNIGNIGLSKLVIYENAVSNKNGELYVKLFKEGVLLGTYSGNTIADGVHEPKCTIDSDDVPELSSAGTVVYYVYYGEYEAEQNGIEFPLAGQTGNTFQLAYWYKKSAGFYFNLTCVFLDLFIGVNLPGGSVGLYGTGNDSQYNYTLPSVMYYTVTGTSSSRSIRISGTTTSNSYVFSELTPIIDLTANNTQFAKLFFVSQNPYTVFLPRIYDTFTELDDPNEFNLVNTQITLYNGINEIIASAFTTSLNDTAIIVPSSAINLSAMYKIEAKKWHYETSLFGCRIGRPFNYYAYGGNYLHILKDSDAYTGETGFVSYKKLRAITLEREENACMTARELNDYKHSFSGVNHQMLLDLGYDGESGYCQGTRKVVPSAKYIYRDAANVENLDNFKKSYIYHLRTPTSEVYTSYTLPTELENMADIKPVPTDSGISITEYGKYDDNSRHCYVMDECIIPVLSGYTDDYLTFYTTGNESNVVLTRNGTPYEISLQFNYDSDGWADYTIGTEIHLYEYESVKFRANPNSRLTPNFSKSENDYYKFNVSHKVFVKGDLKYLINGTLHEYVSATTSDYCFYRLFYNQAHLYTSHLNDLEIKFATVDDYAFSEMFEGCVNLKYGSDMSSIATAGSHAFERMYKDCTGLEFVGSLGGLQNINEATCKEMFLDCKSLKHAAAFNLTSSSSIDRYGLYGMYEGCESLMSTPLLNNVTRYTTDYCCARMFKGCKSIYSMQEIKSSTVGFASFYAMFSGCTNLSIAQLLLNENVGQGPFSVGVSGCSHMFIGCTNLSNGDFKLQLEELSDCCYQYMFYDCVKLKKSMIGTLPSEEIPNYGYQYMFYNCKSLDDLDGIMSENVTKVGKYGCAFMFACCDSLNFVVGLRPNPSDPNTVYQQYVVLSATEIGEGAYNHMFYKCKSLTSPSNIIICAMTLNHYACESMFEDCEKIVSVSDLSNVTKIGYRSCYAMYRNSGQPLEHDKLGHGVYTADEFKQKAFVVQKNYILLFEEESSTESYSVCSDLNLITQNAYGTAALVNLTNKASFYAIRGEVSSIGDLPTEGNINGDIYMVNAQKYIWYENMFCRLLAPVETLPSPPPQSSQYYLNYDIITVTGDTPNKTYMLEYIQDYQTQWVEIPLGTTDYIAKTFENMFHGSNVIIASMRINTSDLSGPEAFKNMFSECKCLESGPELCDKTIYGHVGESAYEKCFYDCNNLTNILYVVSGHSWDKPYLIYGTYGKNACNSMYKNCHNLKYYTSVHPDNSSSGVSQSCFQEMFANCYSMTEFDKYALSACTTMQQECYNHMFFKCESLKKGPILPAVSLATRCYNYMYHKANSYTGKVDCTYSFRAKKIVPSFYDPINQAYLTGQTTYYGSSAITFSENMKSDGYDYSRHLSWVGTESEAIEEIENYAFSKIYEHIQTILAATIPIIYRVKYEQGDEWTDITTSGWSSHNGQHYEYTETGEHSVYRTGTTINRNYYYDTLENYWLLESSATIINVFNTGVSEITANFSGYTTENELKQFTEEWVSCLKDVNENTFYKNPNWNPTWRGINGIPLNWETGNYNNNI